MQTLFIDDHSAALPGLPASSLPIDGALMHAAANRLPRGLMVFDADARVLACNEAARRTVQAHPSLELVPTLGPSGRIAMRLLAHGASHQVGIEQAVSDCGLAGLDDSALTGEPSKAVRTVLIRCHAADPGLVLHLAPLHGPASRGELAAMVPAVLGSLVDRTRQPRLDARRIGELFDLSAASARVAEVYLRVDSVKEAARALGISNNTVKTHLALVYERTGCTRQSQLVRLLMALADGCSLPDAAATAVGRG